MELAKTYEWVGDDDNDQKLHEAKEWFRRFPECYAKIGNWKI